MGQYAKNGCYAGYDKNHKERQKDDYYATPPEEAFNIVTTIMNEKEIDFSKSNYILDPCCGAGHLMKGIIEATSAPCIIGTDIRDRTAPITMEVRKMGNYHFYWGERYDFLLEEYEYFDPDYIIMNPPFKLIEPFCMHALEIARKGVLMLGRLQFLETKSRYENIFRDNPPDDVYVYIDRVGCPKNGDFSVTTNKIDAYAWFWWSQTEKELYPRLHWIHKAS